MLTETVTYGVLEPSPRLSRAREAVMRALDAFSGTCDANRAERGARLAAAREAVVAYTRWMREQGVPSSTVIAHVKALVRGAPSRGVQVLRDVLPQWTISAYYQAD